MKMTDMSGLIGKRRLEDDERVDEKKKKQCMNGTR